VINFGIITISDGVFAGKREDLSGPALKTRIAENGWMAQRMKVVPDEKAAIQEVMRSFASDSEVDIILTTGGTGFTARDVTPEATKEIIEKEAAPLAQIMLLESYKQNPKSVLSRGIAGILNQRLIINLPGSPKGAVENLNVIIQLLPHAVELLRGTSTSH
jgi:molybdenum cofactor synthesis domain-containing protein